MTTAAEPLPVDDGRPAPSQVVELQCMEIWGGHRATDATVSVAGLDAWVLASPYQNNETGGDIYYLSTCGSGRVSRMILADVAGHGDSVDGVARDLRELMRKNIGKADQTQFARALNTEFNALTEEGSFATAVLATYFEPTEQFIVCNAGHPLPLWYRAEDDNWQAVRRESTGASSEPANLPFGVIDEAPYEQFVIEPKPDDLIVLYSDALIEAKNGEGDQLGQSGLLEIVRGLDPRRPARFVHELRDALRDYTDKPDLDDDATIIVLHRNTARSSSPNLRNAITTLGKMLGLGNVYIEPK